MLLKKKPKKIVFAEEVVNEVSDEEDSEENKDNKEEENK